MRTAPGDISEGRSHFVALGRFSPNTLLTGAQDDVYEVDRPLSFVTPPRQRRRITAHLRAAVVEAYESGQTSRQDSRSGMLFNESRAVTQSIVAPPTVDSIAPSSSWYLAPTGCVRSAARACSMSADVGSTPIAAAPRTAAARVIRPSPPSRRILITGASGASKGTLRQVISNQLDPPTVELDSLHHGPSWTVRPTFIADVDRFTSTPDWVMEWQYSSVKALLLSRSDVLVWLDHTRWTVMQRVVRRTFRRRLSVLISRVICRRPDVR
jgi:hypothetical protein